MRLPTVLVKYGLAAVSAGLIALAFPPLNFRLLVFVALVPFLMGLTNIESNRVYRYGLFFGFLYYLIHLYFLVPFVSKWTESILIGILPWLLGALIGMNFFGLAAWACRKALDRSWLWAVPLLWMALEFWRAYMPGLSFPYGLLASPLWTMPSVIQSAAWGGIFLVCGWIALANTIVFALFTNLDRRQTMRLASVWLVVLALSWVRFGRTIDGATKKLMIAQPGVDFAFGDRQNFNVNLSRAIRTLLQVGSQQKPDLMVFPEGLAETGNQIPPSNPFGPAPNVPMIFGARRKVAGKAYQSAFGWDGKRWTFVDKTKLVVFGEYVPMRSVFPFISQALRLPAGDLDPGNTIGNLDMGDIKVAPQVCFEALFPVISERQSAMGANLLVTVCLDDWYFSSNAPEQLMSASVFRSIECGLPMVRTGSLGISIITNARGEIVKQAPPSQLAAVQADVKIPASADGFAYRGWVPWVGVLVFFFVAADHWRGRVRRSDSNVVDAKADVLDLIE